MKTLVVEDDVTSCMVLRKLLSKYGESEEAVNGKEAVEAFKTEIETDAPFDLICLDIMMPEMNGQETLTAIRKIEESKGVMLGKGVKIIMTTALGDGKNVMQAFKGHCDAYLRKPIEKKALVEQLEILGLITVKV